MRLVRLLQAETDKSHGAIQRVAAQLGYGVESVRQWAKQVGIDAGDDVGERSWIKDLEQEVRELRRAKPILKSASAFFAAELHCPQCDGRLRRPAS